MSTQALSDCQAKMRAAQVAEEAIAVFTHYYHQLEQGETGLIPEDSIAPLLDPPMLEDVQVDPDAARDALGATVVIKLNGGLGTSMGLDRAKTLLPVRAGRTFLDLIVDQLVAARRRYGARLPLLLMNSFRTERDTVDALAAYPDLAVEGLPWGFVQNAEPKVLASDLTPVTWPADPSLEWCPPGHGDLYTALLGSGILDALLDRGFRYASVSNGDNLGAAPSASIAGWFAASGAPYAAEVCRRTVNDRKGGHLAIRRSDGQLILRDTAQTPPEDMHYFTDEHRHPFFHTNNLWFDVRVLRETLNSRQGVLGLPLIRNEKHVDPSDIASPKVVQIETAMGSAIQVFPGATAICVGRDRFLPVKTTNELLLVRSDVYALDAEARLIATTETLPAIDLDPRYFGRLRDFEERFPSVPSLSRATSFTVRGDVRFRGNVSVVGHGLIESAEPITIPEGTLVGSADD